MCKIINLMNKKFHYLKVIDGPDKRRNSNNRIILYWKCKCKCGEFKWIIGTSLKNGSTKSCGCYNREMVSKTHTTHGLSGSVLNKIWTCMNLRCHSKSDASFKDYGARGIKVCKSWRDDFMKFYKWAKPKYKKGLQIDRENNDGDYKPSNCRFVTSKINCRNRRNSQLLKFQNKNKTVAEWGEITGLNVATIRTRIALDWSVEKIIQTPARKLRKRK